MSTIRSIRLINAVENGTVLGAELDTFLTDTGRLAEFTNLLSSGGQARRIAVNQVIMDAVIASVKAYTAVFVTTATPTNGKALKEMVKNTVAMTAISESSPVLNVIAGNDFSWGQFSSATESIYYSTNMKSILANLAGLTASSYANIAAMITDPTPFAAIVSFPFAVKALLAHPSSTATLSADGPAMGVVAADAPFMAQLVVSKSAMDTMVASATAMTKFVASSASTVSIAESVTAITAVADLDSSWNTFLAGPHFAANLKNVIANLLGLTPGDYADVAAIIDDPTAAALIVNNSRVVEAINSNSAAVTSLAASPNLVSIISESIPMSILGINLTAVGEFLAVPAAIAPLFASSVSKGSIFSSTTLVNAVATTPTTVTYLLDNLVQTAVPTSLPDATIGAYQTFEGVPAKLLTLTIRQDSAVATFNNYQLLGTTQFGDDAGVLISSVQGSAKTDHVATYSALTWDLKAIAATAAVKPSLEYIDMT